MTKLLTKASQITLKYGPSPTAEQIRLPADRANQTRVKNDNNGFKYRYIQT